MTEYDILRLQRLPPFFALSLSFYVPDMAGATPYLQLVRISDCMLAFMFACRPDVIPNLRKIRRLFQLQTMVPRPEGSSEGHKNAKVHRIDNTKKNGAGCIVLLRSNISNSCRYVLSSLCTGRNSGYGPGSDQDLQGYRSFAQVSFNVYYQVSF